MKAEAAPGPDSTTSPPAERRTTGADLVGVLAVAAAGAAAIQVTAYIQGYGIGTSQVLRLFTLALLLASVAGVALVSVREHVRGTQLVHRLTEVWRDPPGGWVAFALGAIVVLPIYLLFTPVLFGDADSARLLAASRYILDGHSAFDYFAETQEPFLPPLVLAPAVAVNSLAAVKLFVLLSLQATAAVTSFVTYKATRSLWGAAGAALTLLCLVAVVERAARLPFYGVMLSLGYLGTWYAYRAVTAKSRPWAPAVAAGVLLALTPEAHGIGQLFLAAPLLVVVFAPSVRAGIVSLTRIYGVLLIAMLPRLVVNLSVGGTSGVTSVRSDYWITEGHLTEIQNNFMVYEGINEPLGDYLWRMPARFVTLLGPHGWIIVAVAALGAALALRRRSAVFAFGVLSFFALVITVKQIPPFPRYYAPLWPALAILVGLAIATLARSRPTGRSVAVWLTVVLGVVATVTIRAQSIQFEIQRHTIETNAIHGIVDTVTDGKGVLGSRAAQVFFSVTTEVPTWGGQFLTEEEHVTFLTWPSDEEVLEIIERHDIGWVYITSKRELELDYNDTWLQPAYGQSARHVDRIAASPNFCPRHEVRGHIVYQVGPCPEAESGADPPAGSAPGTAEP